MKYKLEAPFRYISGVIERRYNSDGSRTSLIARKDGTLFWRTDYPRRAKSQELRVKSQESRVKS